MSDDSEGEDLLQFITELRETKRLRRHESNGAAMWSTIKQARRLEARKPNSLVELTESVGPIGLAEIITRGEPGPALMERRSESLRGAYVIMEGAPAERTQSGWETARRCFDRSTERLGIELQRDILTFTGSEKGVQFLKNLFLMVMHDTAHHDMEGRRRKKRIDGGTIARYMKKVTSDLEEVVGELPFLTTTINNWRKGYDRLSVRRGKLKKRKVGFTPHLLGLMMEQWVCRPARGESGVSPEQLEELKFIMLTAVVTMFAYMMRRSEAFTGTDKNGIFHGHEGFSRANAVWLNLEGEEVIPTPERLEQLWVEGGILDIYPGVLKSDQDKKKYGHKCSSYLVGASQRVPNRRLDVTWWLMEMEKKDPILDKPSRRVTPMFMSPITLEQIKVDRFDREAMAALGRAFETDGINMSKEQIKEDYSLKSFRAGGLNGLEYNGVDIEIRKKAGRWSSESGMQPYSWIEKIKMACEMEKQEHDIRIFQSISPELPILSEMGTSREGGYVNLELASGIQGPETTLQGVAEELTALNLG